MNEEKEDIIQNADFEPNGGEVDSTLGNTEPKEDTSQASAEDTKPKAKDKSPHKVNFFNAVLRGDILKALKPHLGLIFYLAFLGIITVSYRYRVESLSIKTNALQEEIEEIRIRQIQMKCEYMNATMVNEVAKKLESTGIKEGRTPSNKITISK